MKDILNDVITKVAENEEFSGVISIQEKDVIVYEQAFGYAERENKRYNNTHTKFAIASGTKLFTALAIGKLIDEKKLTLDSKALDYVDYDFPTYDKDITIRDLMTHTSGMPDYFDEDEIEDFDNFQVAKPWCNMFDPQDYYDIFPQKKMRSKPGEVFAYNNSGFVMLAGIVAKVSGKRYVDYVKEEILIPCKMEDSGFYQLNQLPKNTATGYVELENAYRSNIFNLPIIGGGDGGMYTTISDMYKFWNYFMSGKILSSKLVDLFTKPYKKESDEQESSVYYGYGIWMNVVNENVTHLYIEGCDAGISFRSGMVNNSDIVYTIMSNTTLGVWAIVDSLFELVDDQLENE